MVTTATPAPEAPAPAPEPVSSVGRIFGALFSPQATFASIAAAPTWILPLVLLVIVGLATSVAISQHVGWRTVIDKQISSSSRAQKQMDSLTPEARENALNTQAKYTPYFIYPINFVAPFLVAVIVAAILLGAFNLIGGAKIGFKTSLSIVSYSWVPGVIAALLGIAILYLKDPSTIDVQNLVASNPGAILSDDSPKWLVSLLGSLDLFSFWTMILMAFGYSAAEPKKISFGKAFGTVFGVWIVYVAIKVGWAAAFS
jgi:hypothetical protein